ncbi:hypothetical protein ACP70R_019392 [Stipagrostis hirtigluma subsp. patula]
MEVREGDPLRRAAAGNAEGNPAGGPPGPQEEEEWAWGSSDEGGDDEAVVLGGVLSMSDEEEEEVEADPGVRVPGKAPNTCCICWEPWASCGAHRICCIPCGHVYGRSCLERWLIRRGGAAAKCPGCGEQFEYKHILNLYATERLWDDRHHEQAVRHAAMEEATTWHFLRAAVVELARKDEMIAQMEAKIARMTLNHEIRIYLTKIQEIRKSIDLLDSVNMMLVVVIAALLCALVALLMKV